MESKSLFRNSEQLADGIPISTLAAHSMAETGVVQVPTVNVSQPIEYTVRPHGHGRTQPPDEDVGDASGQPERGMADELCPGAGGLFQDRRYFVIGESWNDG